MTATLPLTSIRIDGGTQPRSKIDEAIVAEYADAMRNGAEFPPLVVFHDGVEHWLADGFHRFHAARQSGAESFSVDIRTGTKRDAILYSVGANSAHGQRRTNEDKRRAVKMLLDDAEWSQWSDSEIARRCFVSRDLVQRTRPSLADSASEPTTKTFKTKHGAVSTMRTGNIGKRAPDKRLDVQAASDPTQRTNVCAPVAQSRGVALAYGHKAIEYLQQIPLNDALRDDALDTVVQWISDNR